MPSSEALFCLPISCFWFGVRSLATDHSSIIFKLIFNSDSAFSYFVSSACNTFAAFFFLFFSFLALWTPIHPSRPYSNITFQTGLSNFPSNSPNQQNHQITLLLSSLQECLIHNSIYNMWEMTIKDIFLARGTTELEKRLFPMYRCIPDTQHYAWHLTNDLKLMWLNECSYSSCIRRGVRGEEICISIFPRPSTVQASFTCYLISSLCEGFLFV